MTVQNGIYLVAGHTDKNGFPEGALAPLRQAIQMGHGDIDVVFHASGFERDAQTIASMLGHLQGMKPDVQFEPGYDNPDHAWGVHLYSILFVGTAAVIVCDPHTMHTIAMMDPEPKALGPIQGPGSYCHFPYD